MGSDGPVPNPRWIRYLAAPPGSLSASVASAGGLPGASALMACAQMANLGFGLANLGVSVAVLVEVRKQSRMLRELQAEVGQVSRKIDKLLDVAVRTDLNVAEGHLREGLRHAMASVMRGDSEVDLVCLAGLVDQALEKFLRSLGGTLHPGLHRNLLLSADVRELIEAALHLLWSARRTALEAHNVACAGDPTRVQRDDEIPTVLRGVAEAAALLAATRRRADEAGEDVRKHLHNSWVFFGDTASYRKRVQRQLTGRLESDLRVLKEATRGQGPAVRARR